MDDYNIGLLVQEPPMGQVRIPNIIKNERPVTSHT